ncbi:hypothetical protein MKW94_006799 [Papaver nudicaule]|uniref:Oxysterol-binding protein n=1 Tax=Papaver nudicaule TaxID=74823 RepID=A0AA41SND5_PAPNU|nr:hypothetical protein [Papaver nudicaule]
MASKRSSGGRFFSSIKSSLSSIAKIPISKSVSSHETIEVISPDGDSVDAAVEATKGKWKPDERESLWKLAKKYLGADIISLDYTPISYLEPTTNISRMGELLEYSHLLDQADVCEDPYLRMVYASSWALSVYFALSRPTKPFNPVIGETFEMVNHDGITYIGEQVSHYPPIDAAHGENEHFIHDITSNLRTKLLGNSLDIYPSTRTRITLKRDGVVLDADPPHIRANNLIFGRLWVSLSGELTLTNMSTGDYTVLKFQPSGWFGGSRCQVDGFVYNAAKEPKMLMTGKWSKSMSYQPCDREGKPLEETELKEVWRVADLPEKDKYQFTYFTHKLNSFATAPRKMLASDSRLRPDRCALEKGDLSKVSREKTSIEARQRNEQKRREANGDKFTPRWFDLTDEVKSTPWGDVRAYRYNGKYDEHRAAVNSSTDKDVDIQPTEFNPWQYGISK